MVLNQIKVVLIMPTNVTNAATITLWSARSMPQSALQNKKQASTTNTDVTLSKKYQKETKEHFLMDA
jgi:hypothetical protein